MKLLSHLLLQTSLTVSLISFLCFTAQSSEVNHLTEIRATESSQNQEMLSSEVYQALDDLKMNKATEKQRALLFLNGDKINNARLNGVISNETYQKAQKDFAAINLRFGQSSAKDAGAKLHVQKRDPGKPYDPGTDSDYITEVSSPDQVRKMQKSYNQQINTWLKKNDLKTEQRDNWHNKLDTDFMADPAGVSKKQFEEISRINNDAYKRRKAARYEALSRMSEKELKEAGVGSGKVPLDVSTSYVKEMEDMRNKKAKKIDKKLNDEAKREKLRNDPNARAELHKIQAQEQKYITRKQQTTERLRQQEGLRGVTPPDRPELTKADIAFTRKLAKRRKEEALKQGKSKKEAERIEKGVLKSLEQNKRSPEAAVSTLPSQAAKRSPDTRAKTRAASGLSQHLNNQANNGYAQTLAEYAGKDSSVAEQTRKDIAKMSKGLSAAEKGELIDQARSQFRRGMKKKLMESLDPETADRIAKEQADKYAKKLAVEMRKQSRKKKGEQKVGASGSGKQKVSGKSRSKKGSVSKKSPQTKSSSTGFDKTKRVKGDVAVINKGAKVTRIDNRKQQGQMSAADVGKMLDTAKKAYSVAKKTGDAGVAALHQRRELAARQAALDRDDPKAAMHHQKKAEEYGAKAQKSLGEAVTDGLNNVTAIDAGKLGKVGLGTYAKTSFETGKHYGDAVYGKIKADEYAAKARQADMKKDRVAAAKYRQLAAQKQIEAAQASTDALRSTPIVGSGYRLGEAAVLGERAKKLRARANEALKKKDLKMAQKLHEQARKLENEKYKKIRSAVSDLPLVGKPLTKIEGVGEEYGQVLSDFQRSARYKQRAVKERRLGNNVVADKLDKLSAEIDIKARKKQIEVFEKTPFVGSMQNLAKTSYANQKANEHLAAAEKARANDDTVGAEKHQKQADKYQAEAKKNMDSFTKRAPKEAAVVATALASGYAPHVAVATVAFKGTRQVIENTESGKRFEEAKTSGTAAILSKTGDLWNQMMGNKSQAQIDAEQRKKRKESWLKKLDNGEIKLQEDVLREDFEVAVDMMISQGKVAKMNNLGDLDIFVTVSQKLTSGKKSSQVSPALPKEPQSEESQKSPPRTSADTKGDAPATPGKPEAEPQQPHDKTPTNTAETEKDTPVDEKTEDSAGETAVLLPDVVGMGLMDAVAALEAVGLFALPEVGRSAINPEDVGKVEVAFPVKDGEVHAGDQIVLRVYDEAVDSGNVPNVTGLELAEAADAIKLAGFNPVFELGDETSDPKKDGTVAGQAPAPGIEIEAGKDVTLLIYTLAVETRTVPNLNGLGLKAAQQKLKSNDLFITPFLEKAASKKSEEGKVYKQYPEPGLDVMNGIAISVWVYGEYEASEASEDNPGTSKERQGVVGGKKIRVPMVTVPLMAANLPRIYLDSWPRFSSAKTTRIVDLDTPSLHYDKLPKRYRVEAKYSMRVSSLCRGKERPDNDHLTLKIAWLEPGDEVKGKNNPNCNSQALDRSIDWYSRAAHECMPYAGRIILHSPNTFSYVYVSFSTIDKHKVPLFKQTAYEFANRAFDQIAPYSKKCTEDK